MEAGEGESRVAVGLDLGVDVGAAVQQQLDGRRVAVHRRQHQRRDAQLRARARVYLGLPHPSHACYNTVVDTTIQLKYFL